MASEETALLLDPENEDESEDPCGTALALAAISFSAITLISILASFLRLASASVLVSLFAAALWWIRSGYKITEMGDAIVIRKLSTKSEPCQASCANCCNILK